MLTSRHLISSSLGMLYVFALCPSACVRLSGLGAAGSLPNPSLTCLRVWDLLWLEQPSPSSVSLSSHVPCPTSQGSAKSRLSQTRVCTNARNVSFQGCMRNTFPKSPFTAYSVDLEQFEASTENHRVPLIFKLKWLWPLWRLAQSPDERLKRCNKDTKWCKCLWQGNKLTWSQ